MKEYGTLGGWFEIRQRRTEEETPIRELVESFISGRRCVDVGCVCGSINIQKR